MLILAKTLLLAWAYRQATEVVYSMLNCVDRLQRDPSTKSELSRKDYKQ